MVWLQFVERDEQMSDDLAALDNDIKEQAIKYTGYLKPHMSIIVNMLYNKISKREIATHISPSIITAYDDKIAGLSRCGQEYKETWTAIYTKYKIDKIAHDIHVIFRHRRKVQSNTKERNKEILRQLQNGKTRKEIAKIFNVTVARIAQIVERENYLLALPKHPFELLPIRAQNALKEMGISNAEDTRHIPDYVFLRIPNFGVKSLREMRKAFGEFQEPRNYNY